MRGARTWCRSLAICAFVLGLAAIAVPGYAQTGQVKGKVVDANGKPVDGATVTIEGSDSGGRKFTVKTKSNGEFVQIGLQPGQYKITASKDNLTQTFNQRISLDMVEVNFTLKPGAGGGDMSAEDRKKAEAKNAALKTAFEEGVALSNAGKNDEAIAKFNEVLGMVPKCPECYSNIGANYAQKKDWAAGRGRRTRRRSRSIPNSADAYNGLANVYNAQKKFDQAAEASAQAMKLASAAPAAAAAHAGGASASAMFNQGVILWNAGKIPEAKKQFEDAVKARSEAGGRALLAGHGQPERRQDAGRRAALRGVSQARPDRPVRRAGQGDPHADQEVARSVSIADNLVAVRARIAAAAQRSGRDPSAVTLVAVSKTFGIDAVPRGRRRRPAGVRREPRPGSPAEDRPANRHSDEMASHRPSPVEQGAQGRAGVRVHPVGRFRGAAAEAGRGSRRARHADDPLDVLVQVDLAGEATKFGAPPDEAERIVRAGRVGALRPADRG